MCYFILVKESVTLLFAVKHKRNSWYQLPKFSVIVILTDNFAHRMVPSPIIKHVGWTMISDVRIYTSWIGFAMGLRRVFRYHVWQYRWSWVWRAECEGLLRHSGIDYTLEPPPHQTIMTTKTSSPPLKVQE